MLPEHVHQPIQNKQFVRYCFDILYYLNLNDINEHFLTDLLKKTLVKSDEANLEDSLFIVSFVRFVKIFFILNFFLNKKG